MTLELLLSRNGEIVARHELREALWPHRRVVMFESSITAVIRELRRALDDNPKAPRFIETVPKRGYRFVAPCTEAEPGATPDTATSAEADTAADSQILRKDRRRGSFLRFSGAMILGLLVLPMGDAGQFPHQDALDKAPITVTVLPFENLTGRPAHVLLAELLPRDIVSWLAAVAPERLRLVDRVAAETAGATSMDYRPADFAILGSVREDRGAAVISATMLSGDGSFVWGEQYRRSAEDSSLTAREVAARIADSVMSEAVPQWRDGSEAATTSAAAAAAFRRGTDALAQLSREGAIAAVDAFSETIELDPEFSAAHAHLAEALIQWTGPPRTQERVERARRAAKISVELVDTNAVGHRVLGEIGLYYDRDWQAAGRRLERSIELSPSNASAHHSYATWLSARGRHDEALREIDLAAALEPGSVSISIDVMFLPYYARDFENTVVAARRLQRLWSGYAAPHRTLVLSYLAMGDVAAAAAEARKVLAKHPEVAPARSVAAFSDSEALDAYWAALLDATRRYVTEKSGDPTALAMLYVQLGRLDAANSALESALRGGHFSYYLPYLGVSPTFDPMCGHPGFERILRNLRQTALSSETRLPRCAAVLASDLGD